MAVLKAAAREFPQQIRLASKAKTFCRCRVCGKKFRRLAREVKKLAPWAVSYHDAFRYCSQECCQRRYWSDLNASVHEA